MTQPEHIEAPSIDDGDDGSDYAADPDREQHEAEHGKPEQTFELPPSPSTRINFARRNRTIE